MKLHDNDNDTLIDETIKIEEVNSSEISEEMLIETATNLLFEMMTNNKHITNKEIVTEYDGLDNKVKTTIKETVKDNTVDSKDVIKILSILDPRFTPKYVNSNTSFELDNYIGSIRQ